MASSSQAVCFIGFLVSKPALADRETAYRRSEFDEPRNGQQMTSKRSKQKAKSSVSSSPVPKTEPPDSSELELSVFGPGRGECLVVHLGAGEWMVVDSCLNEQ